MGWPAAAWQKEKEGESETALSSWERGFDRLSFFGNRIGNLFESPGQFILNELPVYCQAVFDAPSFVDPSDLYGYVSELPEELPRRHSFYSLGWFFHFQVPSLIVRRGGLVEKVLSAV